VPQLRLRERHVSAPATPINVPVERLPQQLEAARQTHARLEAEAQETPAKIDDLDERVAAGDLGANAEQARLRLRLRKLPREIQVAADQVKTLQGEYQAALDTHVRQQLASEAVRTAVERDRLGAQVDAAVLNVASLAGRFWPANVAAARAGAAAAGQPELERSLFDQHARAGALQALGDALCDWLARDPRNPVDRQLLRCFTDFRGRFVQRLAAAFFDGDAQ